MSNLIIYTSEYLRTTPETSCIAQALDTALGNLQIKHGELKNTNDYWCRDYMPIRLFDDGSAYATYTFNPDYLKDYKSKRPYITDQQEACKELEIHTPSHLRINFEGGNFVRCGNKVVMTDKILMENPHWPLPDLFCHLRDNLCGEIVLLPWDMKDPCGHADGMVAPLDDGRLLLNNCWRTQDRAFHRRLLKILEPHFEIVELSLKPDKYSWAYLNFLRVPGAVLLPCLSETTDCENDKEAIALFHQLFPEDEIVPIYALPLIRRGGALHCVTWELITPDLRAIDTVPCERGQV